MKFTTLENLQSNVQRQLSLCVPGCGKVEASTRDQLNLVADRLMAELSDAKRSFHECAQTQRIDLELFVKKLGSFLNTGTSQPSHADLVQPILHQMSDLEHTFIGHIKEQIQDNNQLILASNGEDTGQLLKAIQAVRDQLTKVAPNNSQILADQDEIVDKLRCVLSAQCDYKALLQQAIQLLLGTSQALGADLEESEDEPVMSGKGKDKHKGKHGRARR